ncbi:DUF7521 family protein [Natronorubrum texcoconense]|uniref:Uncharacterized protein n=1 Tax=Natronorubrum texcoconense TaxID=1095776 RepID=A0A1G9BVF0_9EURY|nr:hypothetical protein [Natronorubrum texcoconense]SDK43350.1 hypothetical protein SAMN04515672_3102 [Natronorubrum texcoconense]
MLETPLQVSEALDPNQFEAAMLAINVLKAFVGLGIAYIAYRGYQRNESRPMLYLSLGFVLVLGVPFALFLVGLPLVAVVGPPSIAEQGVVVASELSQLIGLFVIVYALRL